MIRSLRRLLLLGLMAIGGCSAESAVAPREAIDALIITTTTSTIVTGGGVQLSALVFGVSGQLVNDEPITWRSNNAAVATISPAGFVQGVAPGLVTVTATAGGKVGEIVMLVLLAGCTRAEGDTLSLGGNVAATLTIKPCRLSGGYTAYGHILQIEQAGSIQVDIRSEGFTPSLVLMTSTGGNRRTAESVNGQTASLRANVSPGTYIIWAATLRSISPTNSYSITVQPAAGSCDATSGSSIAIGDSRRTTLSTNSCLLLGGPVAEGWRLRITEPTRLRLVAASPDFPPLVALTDAELNVLTFTNSVEPGSAEIQWSLQPGEYRVWAGSVFSSVGRLDVSVEEIAPCVAVAALTLGVVVNGALTAGDCQHDPWPGRLADAYLLTLAAPTRVQLDLTSATLDPILFVTALDGTAIGQDDDSGEGLNSRLVIDLPAGTYRVWAASYQVNATGEYALSATAATAALQMERAPGDATDLSFPSAKPGRPLPWPAPRTSGSRHR